MSIMLQWVRMSEENRGRIGPAAFLAMVLIAASACAQHSLEADQIKQTQAQIAELQKSVANLNLRLEEINNSVFILQETSKANRDSLKTLKDEMGKPTIYITTTPEREGGAVSPLPQGGEYRTGFVPPAPRAGPPSNAGGGSGDVEFNEASKQFAQGNFGLAALGLGSYLAKNPSSPVALQSRYMLAESYFRLGDHAMAAREFALVLAAPGSGAYNAKATLRSAQCFAAQGQSVKAKELFKKVATLYPGTEEAKAAEQELSKL